jgi:transcriptional regulator with XRE-family HTH domain
MQALKMYRKKRGLTQKGLAEVAGVSSAAMISHYEGGRFDPSPETLRKLGEALGVTPDDLLYAERLLERRQAVEKTVEDYALSE